jgi:predicted aspartyl protease
MGKVLVPLTLENQYDLYEVSKGLRTPDQVRRVEVQQALADTGATMLMLPRNYIDDLGLTYFDTRQITTIADVKDVAIWSLVQLTIQGRRCPLDVGEIPEGKPVLIGQIPLERLDFVVDPGRQRLIANPAHGGSFMLEMY